MSSFFSTAPSHHIMSNDDHRRRNADAEFERQLRRISRVSGSSVDISLRIMLAVISGLQESLTRALDNSAVDDTVAGGQDGLADSELTRSTAPAPPTDRPPALASPFEYPITRLPPPFTPIRPLAPSTGPMRTENVNSWYCIIVGRRVGVFPGPR